MSVTWRDDRIVLSGMCHLEEAETLFGLLQSHPGASVDLSACDGLHGAVLQVLLVARPAISGVPTVPFLRQFIYPVLASA